MAFQNTTNINKQVKQEKAVIAEFVEKYFKVDIMKENLVNHETDINKSLNAELSQIYKETDKEIDDLFYPILEKNVDLYLDYHYSVIGEYVEIGEMAFGDLNKMIERKLFGTDFNERLSQKSKWLEEQYMVAKKNHLATIDGYAVKDVDIVINSKALTQLSTDINNNSLERPSQAATIGASISLKIAALISAKIALKAGSKGVTKGASKLAAKSAAASTGAAAGTLCGPFVWVCSPVAAGFLWFATDAAVVSGDEYFTRDKFKEEIILSLNKNKKELKSSFKKSYFQDLKGFSEDVKEQYRKTHIQEKKMVKIKNKF